jgi:hypothetical protein
MYNKEELFALTLKILHFALDLPDKRALAYSPASAVLNRD